jgi:hypothetical protein
VVFGGMSGSRIGAGEDGVSRHGDGRGRSERVIGGNPLVYSMGGPSSGRVLNGMDRIPHTIVFILHEEEVNMFPRMAFYGGMFMESEVSVRALEHQAEAPYIFSENFQRMCLPSPSVTSVYDVFIPMSVFDDNTTGDGILEFQYRDMSV